MISWRISSLANAGNALSGEGASRFPGRWNRFGTPLVYSASTASLAVLEYVAHIDPNVMKQRDMVLLKIETPEDPIRLSDNDLPDDWNAIPPNDATRFIGDTWAKSKESLSLVVPSVLLPSRSEFTILINPLHSAMQHVKIIEREPFTLDQRVK